MGAGKSKAKNHIASPVVVDGSDVRKAVQLSNLAAVKRLVNKQNLNTVDQFGRSALMIAATNGSVDIVEYLLSLDAATDLVDEDGRTAMMHAASYKHYKIVAMLIVHGANVDIADKKQQTVMNVGYVEPNAIKYVVNSSLEKGVLLRMRQALGPVLPPLLVDYVHLYLSMTVDPPAAALQEEMDRVKKLEQQRIAFEEAEARRAAATTPVTTPSAAATNAASSIDPSSASPPSTPTSLTITAAGGGDARKSMTGMDPSNLTTASIRVELASTPKAAASATPAPAHNASISSTSSAASTPTSRISSSSSASTSVSGLMPVVLAATSSSTSSSGSDTEGTVRTSMSAEILNGSDSPRASALSPNTPLLSSAAVSV